MKMKQPKLTGKPLSPDLLRKMNAYWRAANYTKQLYTLHISKVWKFGAKKDCSAVKWIVWV